MDHFFCNCLSKAPHQVPLFFFSLVLPFSFIKSTVKKACPSGMILRNFTWWLQKFKLGNGNKQKLCYWLNKWKLNFLEQQNLSTQAVLPEEHLQKWHHIRDLGILGNEIVYVMNSLALSDEQDVCGFIVKIVHHVTWFSSHCSWPIWKAISGLVACNLIKFLLSIHLGGTLEWPKEPSLLGSSNLAIDRTEMLHPLGRT